MMIYTLYSFKGGVGRSMALANLAECFYRRHLRVVMIDWDLEAPGLEAYFYPRPDVATEVGELMRVRARPGLIEMLSEYKQKYPRLVERRARASVGAPLPVGVGPVGRPATSGGSPSSEGDDGRSRAQDIQKAERIARDFMAKMPSLPPELRRVDFQSGPEAAEPMPSTFDELLDQELSPLSRYLSPIHEDGRAALWLLSAGSRSPENFAAYAGAVQNFDWLEFLATFDGKAYLEWLRKRLARMADVVLIDSRTGVTEMGGVCTRLMADAVVSFCAPNFQNVDGVSRVVGSLSTDSARATRPERDLQTLVIPTRIDDFESALLADFSEQFGAKLERDDFVPEALNRLERPFWNLQIPYIPKFNYREQRVIGNGEGKKLDPVSEKLANAYTKIAVHMAALAAPNSNVRRNFESEIAAAIPGEGTSGPPRMAPELPPSWVERPALQDKLRGVLLRSSMGGPERRVAVWGPAGSGKSSLVASVCREPEVEAAFPDGVVWAKFDRPWDEQRLEAWLRSRFGLPRTGGQALREGLKDRRFLFVLDDVRSASDVQAALRFGDRAAFLIITRDLAAATGLAHTVVSVGDLEERESAALLNAALPASPHPGDACAKLLLRWPLGASLVREALERGQTQGQSTEEAWNAVRGALERQGITALDSQRSRDVGDSVAQSIRRSILQLTREERDALRGLARGSSATDASRSHDRRLTDLGLATETGGSLRIHPIVRAWLVAQGELESPRTRRRLARAATLKEGFAILRGQVAPSEAMLKLAQQAKDLRAFSLARRLYALARGLPEADRLPPEKRLKAVQQHALCTYKDEDLSSDQRYVQALKILKEGDLETSAPSQETLGLAGAMYKSLWRATGQRSDLERSLRYYETGARADLAGDFGYTRINAAFVLDLLAYEEQQDVPEAGGERRAQARVYREEIVSRLPELAERPGNEFLVSQWWYGATLGEACFGLGRYDDARHWLREATALEPPEWQMESTTRQLALLADAQALDVRPDSESWKALQVLVGNPSSLRSIVAGKFGLALSGGGFRASLFHIGVLARLAELDVLRHVEVLSCVSGGSIVGAHYYLEVRRLLQEKADGDVTREDYVEIVQRIERDFLAGVQRNLRTRLFGGWWANLKSLFVPGYTRTNYLGELLERHIYARVEDGQTGPRWLNGLRVDPKDGGEEFNPKLDNWVRGAKVPILLLNATTLNTGHNWQFAVSWMGESPLAVGSEVDRNDILRRMYYSEAPLPHREVRLGRAVAASACVPGLFEPIELHGLYPDRVIRLVDGGVHDNQGITGLLEQECSVVLVSDASGQMDSQRAPSGELHGVPLRSNSILMARVREEGFRRLEALHRSSVLNGLLFLHLKEDLDETHVDWTGCQDPFDAFDENAVSRRSHTLTSYGVPKTVQARLAGLRTDLDSFSDSEAYALMLSGYRMADTGFAARLAKYPTNEGPRVPWRFLAIASPMDQTVENPREHGRLQRLLAIGAKRSLKVWRAHPVLAVVGVALVLGAALLFAAWIWGLWGEPPAFQPVRVRTVVGVLVAAALFAVVLRAIRKSLTTLVSGALMVTVGWLPAWLHVLVFDKVFLAAGALRKRPHPVQPQRISRTRSSGDGQGAAQARK